MMLSAERIFRLPILKDGAAMHRLISDCPPLDVNSAYLYFLLCDHFRESTVVVEENGSLLGCITGYRQPDRADTLFIWQVAVHKQARGQGLATQMLDALISRPGLSDIRWVETTISPSNTASRRLFSSWAAIHECSLDERSYLESADFSPQPGSPAHEAECLFRIGPLPSTLTSPDQENPST